MTKTEQTLKRKYKTQSGPSHRTEQEELHPQPTSPEPGTSPLGTERKEIAAVSSQRGLHLEVEEDSAFVAVFERDHQMVN